MQPAEVSTKRADAVTNRARILEVASWHLGRGANSLMRLHADESDPRPPGSCAVADRASCQGEHVVLPGKA